MLYSFIIISSIWFGFEIINLLCPSEWDQLAVLAGAVPIGFALTSWIYYIIKFLFPLCPMTGIIISLLYMGISYLIHSRNKKLFKLRAITPEFIIVLVIMAVIFLMLLYSSILYNGTSSSGTNYSDLPIHLSLISSMAFGGNSGNSKLKTTFYAGTNLSYPIIPDFFSSILLSCGRTSFRISIAVPSFLLLLSLTISLHTLGLTFSNLRFVPELTIVFFMLASGTGWRYAFLQECRNNPNTNYVHTFCTDVYTFWIHSLVHFLIPQRSASFSEPIVVLSTILLILIAQDIKRSKKTAHLAGLMMGLLPMISAHSYIALGEYAIFICLLTFPFRHFQQWIDTIKTWSYFGIPAILLSFPQVLWLLQEKRANFAGFAWIYAKTDNSTFGFFKVWWSSLGAFAFLSLICVWGINSPVQNLMYIPSIGVWIFSNIFKYQPGEMDNTKVFLATWYPLACSDVAAFIITIWISSSRKLMLNIHNTAKKKVLDFYMEFNGHIIKLLLLLIIFGFSYGSIVCIYRSIAYIFPMFNESEKQFGLWVMENTDKNAVMMTDGWLSNPAFSLAGRIVTLGYPGWVWTHGLDYESRNNQHKIMNAQKEDSDLFDQYNIKYVMKKTEPSYGFEWTTPTNSSRWIEVFQIRTLSIYRRMDKYFREIN